jgi:hypothetical protein
MADLQPTVKDAFFSPKNEAMLQRLLNTDVQRRIGGDLGEKQEVRLKKTIHHYMGEVYYNPENAGQPIQSLNKEVLRAVVPDFMGYLKRNETAPRPTTAAGMETVRMDVTSRFDQMQTERQGETKALPAPPKFQISLEDADAPSSLSLFEQAKRAREEEARRMEESAPPSAPPAAVMPVAITPAARAAASDLMARLESEDDFRTGGLAAAAGTVAALAARDAARAAAVDANRNAIMPVPPDGRGVLFGENGGLLGPRSAGIATANPTLALPDAVRTRPPLPQDVIKPQSDVLTYKENEYNLFVYSADRDWVNNTTENRYNFSVNFDPANNRSGFGLSPATNIRFKNISRIELVKVIMPTEACEVLVTKTAAAVYETDYSINALSYPYLQVRIDELNNNGYGTNDGLNNAFGVISYDAYWASDSSLKNRGWTRMIPKFLKCQKVYSPTPLATLNKLTIQIQKPDGNVFCSSADALDVSGAVFSSMLTTTGTSWIGTASADTTGTIYTDVSGEFIWLQTSKWFSEFAVTQGDRIVMKNLAFPSTFAAANTQAATDMLNYLTRPEGHVVVDIAQTYVKSTTTYFKDGSNKQGYSNWILIRNDFGDPITGSTALNTWATNTALRAALEKDSGSGPGFSSGGRLLNLNHQIQIIFRVITRDMDSATRIRPDNL